MIPIQPCFEYFKAGLLDQPKLLFRSKDFARKFNRSDLINKICVAEVNNRQISKIIPSFSKS